MLRGYLDMEKVKLLRNANYANILSIFEQGPEYMSRFEIESMFKRTDKNHKYIGPSIRNLFVRGQLTRKIRKHKTRKQKVFYYKLNRDWISVRDPNHPAKIPGGAHR